MTKRVYRFADDDVSYSINTDDPLCFENTVMTEYQLAYKDIGLSKLQLWKSVSFCLYVKMLEDFFCKFSVLSYFCFSLQ